MSIKHRGALQPGERVVVTGASGVSGRMALQIARLLGAADVVAMGRDEAALEAVSDYADATICMRGPALVHEQELRQRGGHDLTIDLTWPARLAALSAQNKRGRLVQVGSASQPGLGVEAAPLRGNAWSILGFSIFNYSLEERRAAYLELLEHVRAGRIEVPIQEIALDDLPAA